MYNGELKARFLEGYTTNVITAKDSREVFNNISEIEEKYDKDFACMSIDQAQEAINCLHFVRSASMESRMGMLRKYVLWNAEIGTPGTNTKITALKHTDASHLKSKLIKNPMHLAKMLNAVYAPVSDNTIDNIARLYIWLFYAGMDDDQVFRCTKNDIDYKNMAIYIDNEYFPIYRECLDVIVFCAEAEEFTERRSLISDVRSGKSPRVQGDELYRGIRKLKSRDSVRSNAMMKLNAAFNNGTIDVMLSRRCLTFSGMFYRMYEREAMGFPVDFTNDAIRMMKGKSYKTTHRRTINVKRARIARDLADDYYIWKEAYDL